MRRIQEERGGRTKGFVRVHVGTVFLRFTPPGVSRETELVFTINADYTVRHGQVVLEGVPQVATPIRTQATFEERGWQGSTTASVEAQQTLPESEAHKQDTGTETMKTPEGMKSTWHSDDVVEKGKLPGHRTPLTMPSRPSQEASRSRKRPEPSTQPSTPSRSTIPRKPSKRPARNRRR